MFRNADSPALHGVREHEEESPVDARQVRRNRLRIEMRGRVGLRSAVNVIGVAKVASESAGRRVLGPSVVELIRTGF